MKHLRAVTRIIRMLALTAAFMSLQCVLGRFKATQNFLPRRYMKSMTRLFGIGVAFNEASAPLVQGRPVIYALNHMSPLDPPVVGGILRDSNIVAAGFARTYAVVGHIAAASRPIFVRRHPKWNEHNRSKMISNLNAGRNVIIFPEGNMSDGTKLYHFYGGLLGAAFGGAQKDKHGNVVTPDKDACVQPIALRIVSIGGKEPDAESRLLYTLYNGDNNETASGKAKLKQLWNMLGNPGIKIELTALPALEPKNFESVGALADAAELSIRKIVAPGQTEKLKRPPQPTAGESV